MREASSPRRQRATAAAQLRTPSCGARLDVPAHRLARQREVAGDLCGAPYRRRAARAPRARAASRRTSSAPPARCGRRELGERLRRVSAAENQFRPRRRAQGERDAAARAAGPARQLPPLRPRATGRSSRRSAAAPNMSTGSPLRAGPRAARAHRRYSSARSTSTAAAASSCTAATRARTSSPGASTRMPSGARSSASRRASGSSRVATSAGQMDRACRPACPRFRRTSRRAIQSAPLRHGAARSGACAFTVTTMSSNGCLMSAAGLCTRTVARASGRRSSRCPPPPLRGARSGRTAASSPPRSRSSRRRCS